MNNESGFIALISAIIISLLLLTIVVTLNLTGFLGRFNILDSEFKERSVSLAEACMDTALLKLAIDSNYILVAADHNTPVGSDFCDINSIDPNPPRNTQITIKTKAVFQKATTNLEVVANSGDLSIVSWKECALDTGPCN